ncbi:voltage-gated chloride channel protein [Duganella sp. Leaf61]|uniref:chloride channel protein n=1 Tax=Duganella sp. Leaf61 TaxID=1736227 RepID=UPI0006F3B5F8|nr:chloride channel protein [Duganella sp. Leaf61]KQN75564.1 voltage-gated chloride channel protein [Duganella sp. Leaf61]
MTDHFQHPIFTKLIKWAALSCLIGVLAGAASAAFLLALDAVTHWRGQYRWLIWLLPVAGLLVAWLYRRYGAGSDAGINLLINETRAPTHPIPLRMAPLVLFGTLTSHLLGASVGREGTAVQMGGALSDQLSKLFRVSNRTRTLIITAGMAAGFASVFGTPVAGAIWGIEVVALTGMAASALLPCLLSAVIAHFVTLGLGAHHMHYAAGAMPALGGMPLLLVAVAGVAFGLAARAFCMAIHGFSALFKRWVANSLLRPVIGGMVIVLFAMTVNSADRYLGLGLPVLQAAFSGQVAPQDFLVKLVMTAWSIASGFKGGEVTPLFFVGATLGHVLAPLLQLPPPFLAAVGLAAVFAGASNTPLASTILAIELFGFDIAVYAAFGCAISYLVSGRHGIYAAQRLLYPKLK